VVGKYVATPQGVFENEIFFSRLAIKPRLVTRLSNISVKGAILDLVKHESGSAPLSDHEIVEILGERGIPIARRTVAKYRERVKHSPELHAAEVLVDSGRVVAADCVNPERRK